MAFNNIKNQLIYIASKGNEIDVLNTLAVLYSYSKCFGKANPPIIRKIKRGKEESAVRALELLLNRSTKDTNALHEFNLARDSFVDQVNYYHPGIYSNVNQSDQERYGIVNPSYPLVIDDCEGTNIGTANNDSDYLTMMNTKASVDRVVCNINIAYVQYTKISGYFLKSGVPTENQSIPYNAPSAYRNKQNKFANANSKDIANKEARIDPKSISNFQN